MKNTLQTLGAILCLFYSIGLFAQVDTAWVRRYNGPGNGGDYARAIAVDGAGNVYVTGNTPANAGWPYDNNCLTIKYNSDGDEIWANIYIGPGDPGNNDDYGLAIAVDGAGNAYVTGHSPGSGTSDDVLTIKYYTNGDTAWIRRYNGPGNDVDCGNAIAVDGAGNVYVTGYSYDPSVSDDYLTIKYNSDGDEIWVKRYNGPGDGGDYANAIAVDGAGNIYITGRSFGGWDPEGMDDYATIKYYANGDTAWVRRYNGPGNGGDYARAIAVDGAGNVYVTGNAPANSGWPYDYDCLTIKYNSDGDEIWVNRYIGPGDPGSNDDYGLAIAVDGEGNAYVTGHSPGSGTSDDVLTIKYYTNGDTAWIRRYNGPGNDVDCGNAIAVDGAGNAYVTGYSYDPIVSDDYLTIKYNSDGDEIWLIKYNGPGDGGDYANAIALDDTGNIYITGRSFGGWDPEGMDDYATIKYVQLIGITENEPQNIPDRVFLSQSCPNPFRGYTQINYGVPRKMAVNISIYNAVGQLIETLIDCTEAPGHYVVNWNGTDNTGRAVAEGVYFLQMMTNDSIETTKLILVR